jgi:cell division septation protein DedD
MLARGNRIMTETMNDNFTDEMSFDAEPISPYNPQDNSGRRAMILLGLTFGGLLLLAILVFRLYQPGVRDRGVPPIITADNQPFKVEPADAGGAVTPDQDREVFNTIEGAETEGVTTAPAPEQPARLAEELPDAVQVEVQPAVPVRPEPVQPRPVEPEPAPATTQNIERYSDPVAQPARSSTGSAVAGGNSDWVVQVSSLRSQGEAQDTWNRLSAKFGDVMPSSAYADIMQADLAEKGIYYRVRVAGLADKSAANQLCNKLKAQGQACFVARR